MIRKITFDVYPLVLYVFVSETDESIKDYVEANECTNYKDALKLEEDEEARFIYEEKSSDIYLRFRDLDNYPIIAHEAFHATAYIMRYIGTRLSRSSEESYAYLLQYIIDQIIPENT